MRQLKLKKALVGCPAISRGILLELSGTLLCPNSTYFPRTHSFIGSSVNRGNPLIVLGAIDANYTSAKIVDARTPPTALR
jgi:hypothetical protein